MQEIFQIAVILVITVAVAYPLGKYIANVFSGDNNFMDFMKPVESAIYKFGRIQSGKEYTFKENIYAMLRLNGLFFVYAFLLLTFQGVIPFGNPAGVPNMTPDLAFHTAISFVTNTNQQHYSGEAGLSYLSQLTVICYLQFVSAATGIAVFILLLQWLRKEAPKRTENFYTAFVKSCTRILLPLSIILAIALSAQGVPSVFSGPQMAITMEGDTLYTATGPVAQITAIKQLGTNGGGYFGANSSHPFENPTWVSNILENTTILLLPVALMFMAGIYLNEKRTIYAFTAVMTLFFLVFLSIGITAERGGNPVLERKGVSQLSGSMEGKETRFGTELSVFWGVSTTSTSNGSVNSMHDSHSPVAGAVYLTDMMVNAIFGGVGVGFINFLMYVIIAVFAGGLMTGRTPEFLGKKIDIYEVKIAALVILLHPFLILSGTAAAVFMTDTSGINAAGAGFHSFSRILYEFASAASNNGSGFEGLSDNTLFWNVSTGLVMLFGRFLPIIGPLAIAASLAGKRESASSEGTLDTGSLVFAVLLTGVIIMSAALSFFPVLALGPGAEYFSIYK